MEKTLKLLNAIFSHLVIKKLAITADKQMHFLTGVFGCLCLFPLIEFWAAVVVSITAAFKEFYDKNHPLIHSYDIYDWLASTAGAVAMVLVIFCVSSLV